MRANLVTHRGLVCLVAVGCWMVGCAKPPAEDVASNTTMDTAPPPPSDTAEAPAGDTGGGTIGNLQAAYQGESNAKAKYEAFATKADEEGYARVAQLFRATAKAEEIHAGNHAKAIEALGQTPAATIETPEVGTTEENLKKAIEGETYENETMYPDFLKVATDEAQTDAVRSFNYAMTAEAEHARLYQSAADNLADWKVAGKPFNVCTVCGWTCETVDFEKCPSCLEPKDKYIEVS